MAQKVNITVSVKKNPPGDNTNVLGSSIQKEADTFSAAKALVDAEVQIRVNAAQTNVDELTTAQGLLNS